MSETIARTQNGLVQGFTDDGVNVWRGIPFAKSPTGVLRFQPPQPMDDWEGIRSALDFAPSAPQPEVTLLTSLTKQPSMRQSEDCLYLNIWSPQADAAHLHPVMVWIHGGAYVTGSGAIPWYDGTSFAQTGDVVVVTVNYRLGALGFLHLEEQFGEDFAGSGNLGLFDQIAALRWVQDNIAAFGGDPARVTIFGESAGAGSIAVLIVAPLARGLFKQAILESGSGNLGVHTAKNASATAERVLSAVGVEHGDLVALQKVPVEKWVEAGTALGQGLPFGPVIDGVLLTDDPLLALQKGVARDVPILTGVNLDEFKLYTAADEGWFTAANESQLRERVRGVLGPVPDDLIDFYLHNMLGQTPCERLIPMITYGVFVRGMLRTVDTQVTFGAPTWVYRFDLQSPVWDGRLGACHAQEIPFVFNNLHQPGVENFTGDAPVRQSIAQQMHSAWIAFAHTGNPKDAAGLEWPSYDLERRFVMTFGLQTHVESDPYCSERKAWEDRT